MSDEKRVTRKYAERQAVLVSAAIRLINRRGVVGMTLADVAADLGIAPKAVAYYFKRKEDLASACYLRGLERLESFITQARAEPAGPERVRGLLEVYFDFKRRALAGEVEELTSPNDIRALNAAPVNEAYAGFYRSLRALLDFPQDAPRATANARAHLLIAQLHWTSAWLRNIYGEDYARTGARICDIILGGMASPGQPWNPRRIPALSLQTGWTREGADERFLTAATALINEQGYNGASVDRISAKLNLTKGAFYHHIDNKDELVIACFDRTFGILRRAITQAEAIATTGLERLQTLALALVGQQISGEGVLLRLSAVTTLPEALQPPMLDEFDRIGLRIAALISDGIADGSIRPLDAYLAAQVFIAMVNMSDELGFFVRDLNPELAIREYIRPCLEGLFSGQA